MMSSLAIDMLSVTDHRAHKRSPTLGKIVGTNTCSSSGGFLSVANTSAGRLRARCSPARRATGQSCTVLESATDIESYYLSIDGSSATADTGRVTAQIGHDLGHMVTVSRMSV